MDRRAILRGAIPGAQAAKYDCRQLKDDAIRVGGGGDGTTGQQGHVAKPPTCGPYSDFVPRFEALGTPETARVM